MLTRRRFVQSTALAGAALIVGFRLDGRPALAADETFAPNAFIRIAPDNTVTIIGKHIEFGQGSYTGLATILAEGELLEADAVLTHPEDKESLQSILRMTRRIRDSMDKLVHLSAAPTTQYAEGVAMIDLGKLPGAREREADG